MHELVHEPHIKPLNTYTMSTPNVLCVLGSGPLPGLTLQTLLTTEKVQLQTVVFLSEGQLSTSLRFSHALLCTSMPASREVLAKIQKLLQPGARMVVLEDNNPSTQVCSPILRYER